MEDIRHISDTASWIAAYRALESERYDAVFRDHLARKLAGSRGFSMVEITPNTEAMAFAMVARTSAIDRLVQHAVRKGIDTVINLGAGLDTRPYRMHLPSTLQWIEVDFMSIINYKNELLKNEIPVCKLDRIAADLSLDGERKALFERLGYVASRALIITEGVVGYLKNEEAEKLSKDLYAIPSFRYWIMDYARGRLRDNRFMKKLKKKLIHAPLQFDEAEPLQFFAQQGWNVAENIFIMDEADRIGRKLPLKFPLSLIKALFPQKMRALGNRTYGFVMFSRV